MAITASWKQKAAQNSKERLFEEKIFELLGIDLDEDDSVWSPARIILVTGGWRGGKSTRGACRALRQILRPVSSGLIWLVGPDYVQTNEEFRYLLEWTQTLGLYLRHTMPTDGQRTLNTKTGWRVETKSAKYPERLGSVAPDGIVMCEPGQMPEEVYEMVLGRLMQKHGWCFLAGTLEDDGRHPRWAWYEDMANKWLQNKDGDERAYTLPSWANKGEFPGGEFDPKIQELREKYSEYTFNRRIAGIPVGLEYPCFPELWEDGDKYFTPLSRYTNAGIKIIDGAIGVDYGTSDEHPNAVVALSMLSTGHFFVRNCWMDVGGNPDQIAMVVEAYKKQYGITRVRTDPLQNVLAVKLGGTPASGSGPAPTEFRIGMTYGLISDGVFFYDTTPDTRLVFDSMKRMRRIRDARGRLVYARELGDDAGQACLYAVEELRASDFYSPDISKLGGMKFSWGDLPSRTAQVGRV